MPHHFAEWRDRRLKEVQAPSVARELTTVSAVFNHALREWQHHQLRNTDLRAFLNDQCPRIRLQDSLLVLALPEGNVPPTQSEVADDELFQTY
jgi:hypothetical protein